METTIKVGVANDKERLMVVEELKQWEPKDIHYFGEIVYFKNEGKYYNMKTIDFKTIFNK